MKLNRLGPAVALLLVTACGSAGEPSAPSPARSAQPDSAYALNADFRQAIPP
jgi:hypothetical protein